MTPPTEFLNLDDVLDLCRKLLGDPPPVRDIGLLGSAVARPQTTLGEEDAYPTITEKAAALLQSLVINHALIDGDKRLGWLATAVFLEINNFSVAHVPNDDVYELVMRVASNNPPLSDIVQRLRAMTGEMP
jgi:death-on-curing protein